MLNLWWPVLLAKYHQYSLVDAHIALIDHFCSQRYISVGLHQRTGCVVKKVFLTENVHYWKWNFNLKHYVRLLFGLFVGLSLKGGKLHFHSLIWIIVLLCLPPSLLRESAIKRDKNFEHPLSSNFMIIVHIQPISKAKL